MNWIHWMKLKIFLLISSLFHALKVQSIKYHNGISTLSTLWFLDWLLYLYCICLSTFTFIDVFNSTRYIIISTDVVVWQSVAETLKMITRLRCESPGVTRSHQPGPVSPSLIHSWTEGVTQSLLAALWRTGARIMFPTNHWL